VHSDQDATTIVVWAVILAGLDPENHANALNPILDAAQLEPQPMLYVSAQGSGQLDSICRDLEVHGFGSSSLPQ
jgi:hypothetical protein